MGTAAGIRCAWFQPTVEHRTTDTCSLLVPAERDPIKEVASRCPELDSRIEARVHFKSFSAAEMRKVLGDYHPLFAAAEGAAMECLWEYAGGNFCNWAKVLKVALSSGCAAEDGLILRQARMVLRAVSGRSSTRERRHGVVGALGIEGDAA